MKNADLWAPVGARLAAGERIRLGDPDLIVDFDEAARPHPPRRPIAGPNPFKRGTGEFNLTEQFRLLRSDPKLAEILQAAAEA